MAAGTNVPVQTFGSLKPVAAGDLTVLSFVNGDVTNGNRVKASGREVLIAWNSHASTAYDITIAGPADSDGRTGNVTKELAAGEHVIVILAMDGYKFATGDNAGHYLITPENAAIRFAAIRLPSGVR